MTRKATAADIVQRLNSTSFAMTAETALGWGMGEAQEDIPAALDAAIALGLVKVVTTKDTTYGRNVRFVALVDTEVKAYMPHSGYYHLVPAADFRPGVLGVSRAKCGAELHGAVALVEVPSCYSVCSLCTR